MDTLIPDIDLQSSITRGNILNSKDYYKGKSINFASTWHAGIQYRNDNFIMDIVSYNGALYACNITHLSNKNLTPDDSKFWDVIIPKNTKESNFNLFIDDNTAILSQNDISNIINTISNNLPYDIILNMSNISFKIEKVEILNGIIKLYFDLHRIVIFCDIDSGEITKNIS